MGKLYHSVTSKVNRTVLSGILIIMMVVGIVSYLYQRRAIYQDLSRTSLQIAKRLEYNLVQPIWEYDDERVDLVLELEMEYPHIQAILVKDTENNIKRGKIKNSTGEIINYIPNPRGANELLKCFQIAEVKIQRNGLFMGSARLYLTDRLLRQRLFGLWLKLLAQFLLLSGVLYITVLLNLRTLILRPLSIIDSAVQQLANKDFQVHIPPFPPNELGRLAESFNMMAETILAYSQHLEKKVQERTKALEEANLVQSRFFANITHEFRTPLTLILGPIEALLAGEYGASIPCEHQVFHTISHNSARLLRLINNILDFSKFEAGKMNLHKTPTDIAQLLEFYVSTAKAAAESRGIQILFHNNTAETVVACIDRDLFEKAVFNLISNACKFTPQGGHILVQLDEYPIDLSMNFPDFQIDPHETYFAVSVKDTGIGIPEEKIHGIFDRFNQVEDSTLPSKNEGTGIGLALTNEIVTLHKGKIVVRSIPEKGSTFTIILPCGIGETDRRQAEGFYQEVLPKGAQYWLADLNDSIEDHEKNVPMRHTRTILVVDDAADMRRFLADTLQSEYRVIEAENGQQAIKKTQHEHPDLIIADVMMPEMNGYEMLVQLRIHKEHQGIPILFLTARADPESLIQGFELGANDYIVKPFNTQELRARVKANLDMKILRDVVETQRDQLALQKGEIEKSLEQKMLAYQQLEETETYFREIAEFLPSVIAEIDLAGRFTYLNRAGFDFFEMSQADVQQGCMIDTCMPPAERDRLNQDIQNMDQCEESQTFEYHFVTSRGNQHYALVKLAPIGYVGRFSGVRLVIVKIHAYLNLLRMPDKYFYTRYQISGREKEVLAYLLKGFKNKEIGEQLFISEITVKKHVSSILQKTYSRNRDELVTLIKNERTSQPAGQGEMPFSFAARS